MAASSLSQDRTKSRSRALPAAVVGTVAPFAGLATLSAVQAWEWLFSGLTKLQNGAFIKGFLGFVSNAPAPYGRFMMGIVTTFPSGLLARVVEATEIGLGLSLAFAAVAVLLPQPRVRRIAILVAGAASLVGVVMATNIAVIAHDRAPWTLGMSPFSTGIPVEALLAAISVAGVAEAYSALRVNRG